MADHGDVWHPVILTPPVNLHPAQLGEKRRQLESLFSERGRDPATIRIAPKTHLHFTENPARPFSGPCDSIVEDLLAYQAEGAGEFIFYAPGASEAEKLENLHRIAEEITPHVA